MQYATTLPKDLIDLLRRRSEETDVPASKIIAKALRAYFAAPQTGQAIAAKIHEAKLDQAPPKPKGPVSAYFEKQRPT